MPKLAKGGEMKSIFCKYLDKKKATKEALRDYRAMKFTVEHMDARIDHVMDDVMNITSPVITGTIRIKNPNANENRIINALNNEAILKNHLHDAREFIDTIDAALEALPYEDRMILKLYYIDEDSDNPIDKICDRFFVERSSAYKRIERAVDRLSVYIYGK